MRNLLNPKWLLLINTVPVVILFIIFYSEYGIIKSLLTQENIDYWKWYGLSLVLLGAASFAYSVFLISKKSQVSLGYAFFVLLTYIPFLYFCAYNVNKIIPFSIPRWLIPGDIELYVGAFLIPTVLYALFVLVARVTSDSKEQGVWGNFLVIIIVPVSWYIFSQIILPLWKPVSQEYSVHTIIILTIIGTLAFLFFLIRGVYVLGLKKTGIFYKYQLIWKIPFSIAFPLLGLAVNNGLLLDFSGDGTSGIFGDFNNQWFYILALLNGLFICMPKLENSSYRVLLFLGRCLTFSYTFFFFMVFMPYLPLSVIAINAVGAGFLMLTPLVLFVIHVNLLLDDYRYVKTLSSSGFIIPTSVMALLFIPSFITIDYLNDKSVLDETLGYLYTPDYSKSYDVKKSSLSDALTSIKRNKSSGRGVIGGSHIPYLSTYYNWLVLDNLTLSGDRAGMIETVFFGNTDNKASAENIRNDNVKITKISSTSRFDESQKAWISWIDMEISNNSEQDFFAEYATTIELPVGCWISDYYLYVGDKKEMGILAEKKSAMWVFSQIRNRNRDPGILYYLKGNKVAFRVFPFAKNETRKTGIELIHKEPVGLNIDGNKVLLGNSKEITASSITIVNHDLVYLSAREKMKLEKVHRKPYYHFILDTSIGKAGLRDDFITRVESLLNRNYISRNNSRVSFVNTYVSTVSPDHDWKEKYSEQKFDGGFYLDRGIKSVLFESYKSRSDTYPVIVVVTDSLNKAVISSDYSDFSFAFPESDIFYSLHDGDVINSHSLTSNPATAVTNVSEIELKHSVLQSISESGVATYLPDNGGPDIFLKNDMFEITEKEIAEKNWNSALLMQGKWISHILHPEISNDEWLSLVRYSFYSKIMMPVTSYLVVENEAQKAALKKKQKQVLAGNKSLDPDEEVLRMSEPGLSMLAAFLGLALWFRRKQLLLKRNKRIPIVQDTP